MKEKKMIKKEKEDDADSLAWLTAQWKGKHRNQWLLAVPRKAESWQPTA